MTITDTTPEHDPTPIEPGEPFARFTTDAYGDFHDNNFDHAILPRHETTRLAEIAQMDTPEGLAARARLVEHNLKFVAGRAQAKWGRAEFKGVDRMDVFTEGVAGLLDGINRFDAERGFALLTFAGHWIDQSIGANILQKPGSGPYIPVGAIELARSLETARFRLRLFHGVDNPTEEQMAEEMGGLERLEKARTIQHIIDTVVPIDRPPTIDGVGSLEEILSDPDSEQELFSADYFDQELSDEMLNLFRILSPEEQLFVRHHHNIGPPLQDDELEWVANLATDRTQSLTRHTTSKMRLQAFEPYILNETGYSAKNIIDAIAVAPTPKKAIAERLENGRPCDVLSAIGRWVGEDTVMLVTSKSRMTVEMTSVMRWSFGFGSMSKDEIEAVFIKKRSGSIYRDRMLSVAAKAVKNHVIGADDLDDE